jgi:hypothetical protein
LAIGILITLISMSDEELMLRGRRRVVAFGIGLLNSFYLFLTALGIVST